MGKKDLGEKLLEDYADVFADIINVLIFHGKRLLKEDDIVDGPTASRYKDAEEILDFFKVFAKDERFAECKPVIVEQAKKGAVCMCTVMDYAERQGIEKGKAEGIKEGKAEGIREGKAEGIKEGKAKGIKEGIKKGEKIGKAEQALETAREMIRDNEGIEKIKRYTKLPEERIVALQKELSQCPES